METVSVGDYGGIFKFVKSEKAKGSFLKARDLISRDLFSDAVDEFGRTKQLCEGREDAEVVDLVLGEMDRYRKQVIPGSMERAVDMEWRTVAERSVARLEEPLDRLPQGIFTLTLTSPAGTPQVIVGRKTLSRLWLSNSIPEIFCSQIRADMLLGVLADWRVTESKAVAFYHPITASEKLAVFHRALSAGGKEVDIVFPFPLVKAVTRKEFCSPPEGWDVDASFDHSLSSGEFHIRQVTVDVLRRLGFTSHVLYDPACSTGVFLNSLKQAFPGCLTVGQDLSRKMCDVAEARVDRVHCGSAAQPGIDPGTAHCVFVRFLNSEVVTSEEAELLLSALLPTVAVGGIMVTFGHTPVLISSSNFSGLEGFELLSNTAVSEDKNSIFQYYIVRRIS